MVKQVIYACGIGFVCAVCTAAIIMACGWGAVKLLEIGGALFSQIPEHLMIPAFSVAVFTPIFAFYVFEYMKAVNNPTEKLSLDELAKMDEREGSEGCKG